eukprot:TRINITY_DN6361_c0_g1_i1.p1 TRINITY_DN6361_c0_g1~~TRINITY_DN6361_c0_g1_i1.p1  ORF type:complete len:470 (-),score=90.48 TRINITY_DN6361_c0_g1_i1:130-1539(-)
MDLQCRPLYPVPVGFSQRQVWVEKAADRAMTLAQVLELAGLVEDVLAKHKLLDEQTRSPSCGAQITWEMATMYHVCSHFVVRLTKSFACSLMEVLAVEAQPPTWFVSHWWGERFQDSRVLLRWHARCRELPESTTYWICTFAINQHQIEGDIGGNVLDSAFVEAIESSSCVGTVLLLDPQVTPMKRAWCVLENYVTTIRAQDKLYDLCAMIPQGIQFKGGKKIISGPALLLDSPGGIGEELCEPEGGIFPFGVAEAGAAVDVVHAAASREIDRRRILNVLAGRSDESGEPPEQCDGYQAVNKAIRKRYRGRAMYIAAWKNDAVQLEKLLAEGLQGINDQSPTGASALYIAAERGSTECLRLLLEARADLTLKTKIGFTAAAIAKQQGSHKCVQLLLESKANAQDSTAALERQTSLLCNVSLQQNRNAAPQCSQASDISDSSQHSVAPMQRPTSETDLSKQAASKFCVLS